MSGNGRIVAITPDRKIVYTRIDHHSVRNKTVYVKDGLSGGERALVRNVYDVFDLVNGRLFYLVGNDGLRSLCSVRLDGSSFREEIKYTRDVVARDNNWIYLTAGNDKLSLFRLSVSDEGDGVSRVALGINPEFTRDEKLTVSGEYVYFKNNSDVLCRVRTDGSNYEELVVGVCKLVTVTPEKILYLAVDGKDADGDPVYSLYGMDPDGANREKLIFCMSDIVKVNDWQCLYVRDEKLASKRDIYRGVTDPKLKKRIDKNYKKFAKKKRLPSSIIDTVRLFDLRTKTSVTAAYLEPYPTKYSLKRERKALLKKK